MRTCDARAREPLKETTNANQTTVKSQVRLPSGEKSEVGIE